MEAFFDSFWYSYVALPLLIFFARVCDVSLGTIRIMFVSKGQRSKAPILGFFEVLIWILAISEIMKNLNNWTCYLAYAGGFATGNYIGMIIEEKLALGVFVVRLITEKDTTQLMKDLNKCGYGATQLEASGHYNMVNLVWIIIDRKKLKDVENIIQKHVPNAVYTIEDVKQVKYGVFPSTVSKRPTLRNTFGRLRKGK